MATKEHKPYRINSEKLLSKLVGIQLRNSICFAHTTEILSLLLLYDMTLISSFQAKTYVTHNGQVMSEELKETISKELKKSMRAGDGGARL